MILPTASLDAGSMIPRASSSMMMRWTRSRSSLSGTSASMPCFSRSRPLKNSSSMVKRVPSSPTLVEARLLDLAGGRVDDVHDRDADLPADLLGELVGRIGAEHQQVGAAALDVPGGPEQDRQHPVPFAALGQRLDLREVHRDHDALGRVVAAEPLPGHAR